MSPIDGSFKYCGNADNHFHFVCVCLQKVFFLKCCVVTFRFKNVMFDISPTEEVGDFDVKAKFMGVEMEKVQLHFQVNISQVRQNFTK